MSEFQLSHIALVGARISSFQPLGYQSREELTMCPVAPTTDAGSLAACDERDLRDTLTRQLPVWVHNIISDSDFPQRQQLLRPLRRFEGELRDNKRDEVVSAVLSSGFKSQQFNPLDLPASLSMRERCAMVAHIQVWQDAYLALEEALLKVLCKEAAALDDWCELARQKEMGTID